VHPQFRSRGIGTSLLQEVHAVARRHHRSLLEIQTVRALPGGVAREEAGYRCLTGRGHRPGVTSIRSRCQVAGPAEDAAWTLGDGYSLVQWRDAVPEEIIKDVAALQSRLMLDAPTGDLAAEQEIYDAGRVRDQEATELGRGHRWYSTAARHDATGQIVARTKLSFESDDDAHARQRITIVEPAHRGRRLGLVVKAAHHAYARAHEPALRFIDAWNAEDNTHMRAVNAKLGFQPVDLWSVFQVPVPAG
jgi:GNAT superfamily N-acetyltransferase